MKKKLILILWLTFTSLYLIAQSDTTTVYYNGVDPQVLKVEYDQYYFKTDLHTIWWDDNDDIKIEYTGNQMFIYIRDEQNNITDNNVYEYTYK